MKDMYTLFKEYYDNYDGSKESINMKYNHSINVAKLSKKIAMSLNFNEEEIELIEKCGLLHDIARFKQLTEYSTFHDSISFDHGNMGESILKENNYINYYEKDKEKQKIILATIRNHNKFKIEDNLDEKTKIFCRIIRDADKIDILSIQLSYPIKDSFKISDNVYQAFKKNEMVKNEDVHTKADSVLRHVAFIFDLEYKESFKIINESNVINKIFDLIRDDSNHKCLSEIENVVNNYIDIKIDKK